MELHELVNENGENTGKILTHIEVQDKRNIPEGYYVHIVGVVILNSKNEILLQKRSKLKEINPNKWGIHGGKIDFGESLVDAGIRETYEEIGIKLNKEDLKLLNRQPIPEEKCYSTVFYIKKDVDIAKCVLQKEEVEEVRYFKIDELEKLDSEGIEWAKKLQEIM